MEPWTFVTTSKKKHAHAHGQAHTHAQTRHALIQPESNCHCNICYDIGNTKMGMSKLSM